MSYLPHEYLITAQDIFSLQEADRSVFVSIDPELLYVECRSCGRPVIWEAGKTTHLLNEAQVSLELLDSQCMLLTETCPVCQPDILAIKIQVVRLSHTTDEDLEQLDITIGNA